MMHGGPCPGGARVGRPRRRRIRAALPAPAAQLRHGRRPLPRHEDRPRPGPGETAQGLVLITHPQGQRLRRRRDDERGRASRANGLHQPVTGGQPVAVGNHGGHNGRAS